MSGHSLPVSPGRRESSMISYRQSVFDRDDDAYKRNQRIRRTTPACRREARAAIEDVLHRFPHEVPALLTAIEEGKIDGTCYQGTCACLKGTLVCAYWERMGQWDYVATFRREAIPHGLLHETAKGLKPTSIEERWFWYIIEGDTPRDNLASARAYTWIKAWLKDHHK